MIIYFYLRDFTTNQLSTDNDINFIVVLIIAFVTYKPL